METMSLANYILIPLGIVIFLYFWKTGSFDRNMKKAIKDCKEGKTIAYSFENFQKECKKRETWEKTHPVLAMIKNVYYITRRFIYEIPDLPRYGYRKIKRGWQRAYRGWADEDIWNFDHYLSKVILGGLKRLRKVKMGHPCTIEYKGGFTHGDNSKAEKEYYERNKKEWDDILDKMISSFDLNNKIANGDRESYLPYLSDSQRKEMDCLTLKEDIRRRQGMLLFIKHYFSLWD